MKSRVEWIVAIVETWHTTSDGQIQGATVSYVKDGKQIHISRPINKETGPNSLMKDLFCCLKVFVF